jgi:hypothetical protein
VGGVASDIEACDARQAIDICKQFDGTGPPLWSSGQSSWLQNGDVL